MKSDELIDYTEPGIIELEDLPYEKDGEKTGEESEINADNDDKKAQFRWKKLPYHPEGTRRIGFFILVGAFVVAALACVAYSMATNNNELLKEALFLLGNAAMLGIGYYFGKDEAKIE